MACCPHAGCPGCPLFSLPYAEQLEAKRLLVARAFAARFEPSRLPVPVVLPTHPSPDPLGYRATSKLVLSRERGTIRLGIYQRGTHEVVDLPRCPVHHPLLSSGMRALRELLGRAPTLVSPAKGAQGWLRYAAFQASVLEGNLVVSLVTASDEAAGILRSLAARLAEAVPAVAGVARNVNPSAGNDIFGDGWEVLWGEGAILERLGNLEFRASPSSFLQANRAQAGWVYRGAAGWLTPSADDVALDLYCGVGGLALHLAPWVERVVGVEGSPVAAADGAWSAARAGLENVEFHAGRVEEVLPRLLALGLRPTLVTLNPPRRGAMPEVLDSLRRVRPRAILYVSCNPDSLARDAALLCAEGGYRLDSVQPVDFFPQTEHVETVALFRSAG